MKNDMKCDDLIRIDTVLQSVTLVLSQFLRPLQRQAIQTSKNAHYQYTPRVKGATETQQSVVTLGRIAIRV